MQKFLWISWSFEPFCVRRNTNIYHQSLLYHNGLAANEYFNNFCKPTFIFIACNCTIEFPISFTFRNILHALFCIKLNPPLFVYFFFIPHSVNKFKMKYITLIIKNISMWCQPYLTNNLQKIKQNYYSHQ